MKIGLLTARFGDRKLDEIARFASQAGYTALEIHTRHINCAETVKDGGAAVKKILAENNIAVSSIAHYAVFNRNSTVEAYQQQMADAIAAARLIGTDTVCTLAGFPEGGKSKMQTIR